jgi:hypothetical protein
MKTALLFFVICLTSFLNANEFENVGPGTIYGNRYGGDILLTPEQEHQLTTQGGLHTGETNPNLRWPEHNGYIYVPYYINPGYSE